MATNQPSGRADTDALPERPLSRLERIILIAAPAALVAVMGAGLLDWRDQASIKTDIEAMKTTARESKALLQELVTWVNRRREEVGRDQAHLETLKSRVDECEKRLYKDRE